MTYLLTEIVLALLGAALLGFFLGWWTRERLLVREDEARSAKADPVPDTNGS